MRSTRSKYGVIADGEKSSVSRSSLHSSSTQGGGRRLVPVFTAVDPPTLLEYTFGQPDSVLRWELSEAPGGQTRLVLSHTLPSPDQASSALAGWHTLLDMIPAAIDGEDPQWSQARWDEVHEEYERAIG